MGGELTVCVGLHECALLRRDKLGSHNEVAFVLSLVVVHNLQCGMSDVSQRVMQVMQEVERGWSTGEDARSQQPTPTCSSPTCSKNASLSLAQLSINHHLPKQHVLSRYVTRTHSQSTALGRRSGECVQPHSDTVCSWATCVQLEFSRVGNDAAPTPCTTFNACSKPHALFRRCAHCTTLVAAAFTCVALSLGKPANMWCVSRGVPWKHIHEEERSRDLCLCVCVCVCV